MFRRFMIVCWVLFAVSTTVSEAVDSDFETFNRGNSVICAIDWGHLWGSESMLFIPLENNKWIAWAYPSAYFMSPAVMTAESNNFEGLRLTGKFVSETYNFFIDAGTFRVTALSYDENLEDSSEGSGRCWIINEKKIKLDAEVVEPD